MHTCLTTRQLSWHDNSSVPVALSTALNKFKHDINGHFGQLLLWRVWSEESGTGCLSDFALTCLTRTDAIAYRAPVISILQSLECLRSSSITGSHRVVAIM
jgi:hypothetical protein